MKRVAFLVFALTVMMTLSASFANAAPCLLAPVCTLSDGASSASIDTTSQAGMYNWVVDGKNYLFQQWFWYSITDAAGATTGTKSIDQLGLQSADLVASNILNLTYANSTLKVFVTYTLTDSSNPAISFINSDIGESIRITNVSSSAYTVHFFQYSDFDIADDLQDTVKMVNVNTVDQTPNSGSVVLSETVATPAPTYVELNTFPNTANTLNGGLTGNLANLNNGSATPVSGDVTWAFQWDRALAAGQGFTISKDKNLDGFVPEPASLLLLGGCLLFVGRKIQTRVASN